MNNPNTPYNLLDPSLILDAIESVGFPCTGSLFALNSYENRVYQVGIEDGELLIAKFYRPERWSNAAILEEHQFSQELVAQDIPVIAPLATASGETMHEYQQFRFALFPRRGGRTLELDNPEHLTWMGRFIGRLHAVGAVRPFQHRLQLNVQNYGYLPYQFLREHDFIPAELSATFCQTVDVILEKISEIFARVNSMQMLRLHGDFHPGNVLWSHDAPHIVDLDDCLMGPAVQDFWMLLAGGSEYETRAQVDAILQGYHEFYDFNYGELALINPLRTLRMIHYSAWLAKRWEDPAFPRHFPWFNTPRYWEEQLQQLREQLYLLESTES